MIEIKLPKFAVCRKSNFKIKSNATGQAFSDAGCLFGDAVLRGMSYAVRGGMNCELGNLDLKKTIGRLKLLFMITTISDVKI